MGMAWAYDSSAGTYDGLLVPKFFAAPARDLVVMLRLPSGGLALDVGTGTGPGALAAMESLGQEGAVVGLDPSLEMLRLASANGVLRLVAGEVPGLPFAEGVFDGILANFVLSHFSDYEMALFDMVRVLRPGGGLGVSAWRTGQSELNQLWQDVAECFIAKDLLRDAVCRLLPWDDWFAEARHVRDGLQDAGLASVDVQQREYQVSMSVGEYLAFRESSAEGSCLCEMVGPPAWDSFTESVAEAFRSRFTGPVEYISRAHLAVGTKGCP
jgi:SAM-dependent methyltransferase